MLRLYDRAKAAAVAASAAAATAAAAAAAPSRTHDASYESGTLSGWGMGGMGSMGMSAAEPAPVQRRTGFGLMSMRPSEGDSALPGFGASEPAPEPAPAPRRTGFGLMSMRPSEGDSALPGYGASEPAPEPAPAPRRTGFGLMSMRPSESDAGPQRTAPPADEAVLSGQLGGSLFASFMGGSMLLAAAPEAGPAPAAAAEKVPAKQVAGVDKAAAAVAADQETAEQTARTTHLMTRIKYRTALQMLSQARDATRRDRGG
jgi:hypothetical protein